MEMRIRIEIQIRISNQDRKPDPLLEMKMQHKIPMEIVASFN